MEKIKTFIKEKPVIFAIIVALLIGGIFFVCSIASVVVPLFFLLVTGGSFGP